jgi:CRP-like cAMP-binding protein
VDPPLLADIPESDRRRFLSTARRRQFAKGQIVFHAGDPGDTLHFVAEGHVAVCVGADTGDSSMVNVVGPGGFFGELALVGASDRRSATVSALDDVETFSVRREDFDHLRSQHPSVDQILVCVLAAELRRTTALVAELLFVPAERRVLRRLLAVCEVWGEPVPGMEVPLTQEDLASLAGTTRSTANRALRQAEADGLVTLARARLELKDPQALAVRAGAT